MQRRAGRGMAAASAQGEGQRSAASGNPTPWPELCTRLKRLLSGWAEYFSFGYTGQADEAVGWHVRERVRRFLCRRHKLRVSGTSRFGYAEIRGKIGVVDLHQTRLRRRPVHALS